MSPRKTNLWNFNYLDTIMLQLVSGHLSPPHALAPNLVPHPQTVEEMHFSNMHTHESTTVEHAMSLIKCHWRCLNVISS